MTSLNIKKIIFTHKFALKMGKLSIFYHHLLLYIIISA